MMIKICGMADPETARIAVRLGVTHIGVIFSSLSPRQVDLKTARLIADAVHEEGGEMVGVFVDENLDEILRIASEVRLDFAQLHGTAPRKACPFLSIRKIYVVDEHPLPSSLDPQKDLLLFEPATKKTVGSPFRYLIGGGLSLKNIEEKIALYHPDGIDISSGVELYLGVKCLNKIADLLQTVTKQSVCSFKHTISLQQKAGRYGSFGGQYVPELLMEPLEELKKGFETVAQEEAFQKELSELLCNYAGRPTKLTEVPRFARSIKGPRIFLKREDLLHTGAHKINHALGQCLLAKKMGKTRVVAETGAGQHGVATATVCALLGLECVVYMGKKDMQRQAVNVEKMRLLGAHVVCVEAGSMTLKEAVNEALRDWAASYETTHYCLGSALGPHPFPAMVAQFQSCIGKEAKCQMQERLNQDPDLCIACVGGGSNAIGLFGAYLDNYKVKLVGVEAGGKGMKLGEHASRFQGGSPGVLHGTYTYVLQNEEGQIGSTHSISAGLDYPAVGPQHADLYTRGRVHYDSCSDSQALDAYKLLAKTEGIIPALESSHALGYLMTIAPTLPPDAIVLVNLSGRGDKDLMHVAHS